MFNLKKSNNSRYDNQLLINEESSLIPESKDNIFNNCSFNTFEQNNIFINNIDIFKSIKED